MAVLLIAGTAAAQSAPIDLAVTYDALHTNHITAQSFWMQGGAVELGARLYGGWVWRRAWRACMRAQHNHRRAAEPGDGGLRSALHVRDAQPALCDLRRGLAGISNGFHSLFSEGSGPVGSVNAGTTSSANALAVDVGGGLDVRLNRHFAVRAFRASYLRTQFPNTTTNVQNSLSLSAGLVLRLGK